MCLFSAPYSIDFAFTLSVRGTFNGSNDNNVLIGKFYMVVVYNYEVILLFQ